MTRFRRFSPDVNFDNEGGGADCEESPGIFCWVTLPTVTRTIENPQRCGSKYGMFISYFSMHSDVVSRRQDFAFLLPKESVETVVRHFHFYATVAG